MHTLHEIRHQEKKVSASTISELLINICYNPVTENSKLKFNVHENDLLSFRFSFTQKVCCFLVWSFQLELTAVLFQHCCKLSCINPPFAALHWTSFVFSAGVRKINQEWNRMGFEWVLRQLQLLLQHDQRASSPRGPSWCDQRTLLGDCSRQSQFWHYTVGQW